MAQTKDKEAKEMKLLNGVLMLLALGSLAVAAMTFSDFFRGGTDDLFLALTALMLAVIFAIMPIKWAYDNGMIFQPILDEAPAHAAFEDAHEDAHGGSNRQNIFIWVALLALTAVEIYLGYIHLDPVLMLVILIGLSLVKAGLIVAYFMHMKFERKSFILTVVPIMIILLCLFAILFPDGDRMRSNRPDPNIVKAEDVEGNP
jgi:cytochrome c oxidase subunit IV